MKRYKREDAAQAHEHSVDADPHDYAWSDWCIYPEYELGEHEGRKFIYAPMDEPGKQILGRRRYIPLSRPGASLFLEFAAWVETEGMDLHPLESEKNIQAAQLWAQIFGVLGLDESLHSTFVLMGGGYEVLNPMGLQETIGNSTRNEGYGGRRETVEGFAREAWVANITLRLYEAATNPGGPDMNAILNYMPDEQDQETHLPSTKSLHGQTPETARRWALGFVEEMAQGKLERRIWPVPVAESNSHGDHIGHRQGWAFNSLLGAMWLQMLWLMRGQPRRCEWCGKVLDLGSEEHQEEPSASTASPSGQYPQRKRRSDSRFCSNNGRCRAKWNYHHGQGKSSAGRKKR